MSLAPLSVATYGMVASADLSSNARLIQAAIEQAARSGARLLITCECALCGYPGAARENYDDLDECALAEWEDQLHLQAQARGIALFLGTVGRHPQAGDQPHLPRLANELLACGAIEQSLRYRKQWLTPVDQPHFSPGSNSASVMVDDWRVGLSICFDVRFSTIWTALAQANCDLFINSAHMAGPDPDPGCKQTVVPALYAARATEWATPLVLCNTAHPQRWLASAAWDARGLCQHQQAEGLMLTTVQPRDTFDPWYQFLHQQAIQQTQQP